jgi:hypothetical protein
MKPEIECSILKTLKISNLSWNWAIGEEQAAGNYVRIDFSRSLHRNIR